MRAGQCWTEGAFSLGGRGGYRAGRLAWGAGKAGVRSPGKAAGKRRALMALCVALTLLALAGTGAAARPVPLRGDGGFLSAGTAAPEGRGGAWMEELRQMPDVLLEVYGGQALLGGRMGGRTR